MRSTLAAGALPRALFSIRALVSVALALSLSPLGCSDGSTASGASSGGSTDPGVELAALVPESGRVFVDLSGPAVIEVPEGAAASTAWDLAFEGYEVYTNSGLSGPGEGGALGPYGPDIYVSGVDPGSPIITRDAIGGAFLRWYAYDYTNPAHALYSRYHVFGVKDGARIWKVQILSYYGDVEGAPVSAMYRLRYAEVKPGGEVSETVELSNIDGTAGGATGSDDSPSECLDLATGERVKLAPKDAAQSSAWHLCFRRETISVNGELGGPRGVGAVDLEGALTPSETVEGLAGKTAASELPRFDAVTYEALSGGGLAWRGDRIVSIFADQWAEPAASPPAPVPATWVVVHAADGEARSLVTFSRFEGATAATPHEIIMRVRPVVK
jgi:hypothetical protein